MVTVIITTRENMTGTGCRNLSFDANLIYNSTNPLSASCSIKMQYERADWGQRLSQVFSSTLTIGCSYLKCFQKAVICRLLWSEHSVFAAFHFVFLSLGGLSLLKISHQLLIYPDFQSDRGCPTVVLDFLLILLCILCFWQRRSIRKREKTSLFVFVASIWSLLNFQSQV